MSPSDILGGLLKPFAILMAVVIAFRIVKLLWLRFVTPKTEEMARMRKGAEGEERVAEALSVFTEAAGYRLFGDVRLSNAQIDFVLVSPYGIFVIEVKNYSGKIYVDPSDRVWTQYLGENEDTIRSPQRQNYGHIAALRELLAGFPKECFHSVVVLAGNAVIKTAVPPGVFYLHEMCGHIRSHKHEILSRAQIDDAVAIIRLNMVTQ